MKRSPTDSITIISVLLILLIALTGKTPLRYAPIADATSIGNVTNVSNNLAGSFTAPAVATTQAGKIVMVFVDFSDNTHQQVDLSTSLNGGHTFSAPINISNSSGYANPPSLAVSGENAFVTWSDAGYIHFRLASIGSNGTVTLSSATIVSNSSFSDNPRIFAQGNFVYVAWEDLLNSTNLAPDILVSVSSNGGLTFSKPINLSNDPGSSSGVQIAGSQNGTVFFAWTDNTPDVNPQNIQVRETLDHGMTYGAVAKVDNPSGFAFSPKIYSVSENTLDITWFDASNTVVYFSRGTGDSSGTITFSPSLQISPNAITGQNPQVIESPNGRIYLAWFEDLTNSGRLDIVISNSTNGGLSFSAPLPISHGALILEAYPSLAFLPGNYSTLFAVWEDSNVGNSDVFATGISNDGRNIGIPINLSNNNGTSQLSTVAAYGLNLYVAWSDNTFGNSQILFRSLSEAQNPPLNVNIDHVSSDTVKWDRPINVSGTTNGASPDTIRIGWGDGTFASNIPINGTNWGPVSHWYSRPAVGLHNITSYLVDVSNATAAKSLPVSAEILPHQTSLTIDSMPNAVLQGQVLTVKGHLRDIDDSVGVNLTSISFNGTGSTGMSSVVTNSSGYYTLAATAPNRPGTLWTLQADFAGNSPYLPSSSSIKTFDTAPMNATIVTVHAGGAVRLQIPTISSYLSFDRIISNNTFFVSKCQAPISLRYIPLGSCFVISPLVLPNPLEHANVTFSFTNSTIPGGHSENEIDMFHETPAGTVDITAARDPVSKTVTGAVEEFGQFIPGIALHAGVPSTGFVQQLFVGHNTVVVNPLYQGSIQLGSGGSEIGATLHVTISDHLLNKDPSIAENASVRVTSSSDQAGISVLAMESTPNSSTFIGHFMTTSGPSSSAAGLLHVIPGDAITASYVSPIHDPLKLEFGNIGESGLISVQGFTVPPTHNNVLIQSAGDEYSVRLIDGNMAPSSNVTATLSYLNVDLINPFPMDPGKFKVVVWDPEHPLAGPGDAYRWTEISSNEKVNPVVDNSAKTVVGVSSSIGNFTIAFNPALIGDNVTSGGGGGGGGLPRPGTGLVLDSSASVPESPQTLGSGGSTALINEQLPPTTSPSPPPTKGPGSKANSNPLDRVLIGEIGIGSAASAPSSIVVNAGQTMPFHISLKNNESSNQNFVLIMQILDSDGVTEEIRTMNGILDMNETNNVTLAWDAPSTSGTYSVKWFVWNGLSMPDALSEVTSKSVNVS